MNPSTWAPRHTLAPRSCVSASERADGGEAVRGTVPPQHVQSALEYATDSSSNAKRRRHDDVRSPLERRDRQRCVTTTRLVGFWTAPRGVRPTFNVDTRPRYTSIVLAYEP